MQKNHGNYNGKENGNYSSGFKVERLGSRAAVSTINTFTPEKQRTFSYMDMPKEAAKPRNSGLGLGFRFRVAHAGNQGVLLKWPHCNKDSCVIL